MFPEGLEESVNLVSEYAGGECKSTGYIAIAGLKFGSLSIPVKKQNQLRLCFIVLTN